MACCNDGSTKWNGSPTQPIAIRNCPPTPRPRSFTLVSPAASVSAAPIGLGSCVIEEGRSRPEGRPGPACVAINQWQEGSPRPLRMGTIRSCSGPSMPAGRRGRAPARRRGLRGHTHLGARARRELVDTVFEDAHGAVDQRGGGADSGRVVGSGDGEPPRVHQPCVLGRHRLGEFADGDRTCTIQCQALDSTAIFASATGHVPVLLALRPSAPAPAVSWTSRHRRPGPRPAHRLRRSHHPRRRPPHAR
ncbi:hypothetical protein DFR69_106228 [Nocardia neocaledoniensis]|uniref:Uncharacterized protein n=1 Tax=Nocardia neocaledoniensis TaxID=236511 RepID=A0A317NHX0_9NOCA|nr:hypothetical protein DFR69_106228 [Nocardia neocaledoniensis]